MSYKKDYTVIAIFSFAKQTVCGCSTYLFTERFYIMKSSYFATLNVHVLKKKNGAQGGFIEEIRN